ncbi:MAG: bifunctional oligoribonuclease/PAP phosphatase NrnA [Firmicutes bacterium]|nr:bifunctional oligoribonuclease/PAP phosphatase NrnA [Bacillota bacterium]
MKNNHVLNEMASALKEATSVLIYPHIKADGDGLGSAAALCHALRKMGKEAYILMEEKVSETLKFLDRGYCIYDASLLPSPDLTMALDCSDHTRFPGRSDSYESGKVKICLDHHMTACPLGDICFVDPHAAATGELVYQLLMEMGVELDLEMAESLYTAILTDTGRFQYSNTSPATHQLAAKLLAIGVDSNKIHNQIYSNVSLGKLRITSMALSGVKLYFDGQVSVARVTRSMLEEAGALMEDTEGIVDALRSIQGVEVAVFLKEEEPEHIRASLRAKSWAEVDSVATRFEGGGHKKAAGCSLYTNIDEAEALIIDAVRGIFA